MTRYFGTDGIRGKVGVHPITEDFFFKLGWAVGLILMKNNKNVSVVIGKDTRISGSLLESALEKGFLSAGVDVSLLGFMPTPAVAYLINIYNATAGAVISASHNNFQDNGVKFFCDKGFKFSELEQKNIENQLMQQITRTDSDNFGKVVYSEQPSRRYINFCKRTINKDIDLSGLKVVIDCANGATSFIADSVFSELGINITLIHNQPNGLNINLDCGSTNTKNLQKVVVEKKADLGIAFDGDGDRLMMVDGDGDLVDGDELVFIIAKAWHANNQLANNIVVGTQMTNLGIRHSYQDLNIDFIEADIGDRFVIEQMQKNNAVLGGEGSGHIICLEKSTTGDGIIAALQVLEVIVGSTKTLKVLKSEMQKYSQTLINVKITKKIYLNKHQALQQAKLKIEKSLGKTGRILIRPSGTEDLIRVMVESQDSILTQQSANELAEIIRNSL